MIPSVLPSYARAPISFERGEGPYLYSADGRKYLDFTSGVAVVALGHANPAAVENSLVTERAPVAEFTRFLED